MSGVSPNSNKGSPKTPGGISKSLLTPCRRVGLSRKWKKSGCSPFISPLSAHNTTPERTRAREEKKRKLCNENEHREVDIDAAKNQLDTLPESTVYSPESCNNPRKNNDIASTPSRNTQISRKKSKVLSLSLQTGQPSEKDEQACGEQLQSNKLLVVDQFKTNDTSLSETKTKTDQEKPSQLTVEENVSKLVKTESKIKKLSLKKSLSKSECDIKIQQSKLNDSFDNAKSKENNPNNLTKECIVVIQNKIFKTDSLVAGHETEKTLQESDSEPDIPLSVLKKDNIENVSLNTLNDDDFISKPAKKKSRNLSTIKRKINITNHMESSDTSQSSQEDMDKRTILVKKTYDKVIKPQKAKSTGSITQKDIEELKARIEMKKKLLMAKAMSIDTEELRGLIKKWQKGCQDALMELLDLMRKKLPDRHNMDYAQILDTLKIPAELVGYDSENDCFITPNDTNVLLSAFKL